MTVKLFLDIRNEARLGEQNYFSWWLINVSPEIIGSVRLELFQSSPNSEIELHPFERVNFLQPGRYLKCESTFKVNRAGQQTLGVRLVLAMESGRVELVTEQETRFHFEALAPIGSAVVEIEGSAISTAPPPPGTLVKIKGDAILRWKDSADENAPLGINMQHQEAPDEANLRELRLVERSPQGVIPVEFSKFARYWSESGRRALKELSFYDERGGSLGPIVKQRNKYIIQLSPYRAGYLTMLCKGTSGNFMVFTPNRQSQIYELKAMQEYRFPGSLLPLSLPGLDIKALEFNGLGTEEVIALVTPLPLIPFELVTALFNIEAKSINYIGEDVIQQFLMKAREYPGAELGYAKVTVT